LVTCDQFLLRCEQVWQEEETSQAQTLEELCSHADTQKETSCRTVIWQPPGGRRRRDGQDVRKMTSVFFDAPHCGPSELCLDLASMQKTRATANTIHTRLQKLLKQQECSASFFSDDEDF